MRREEQIGYLMKKCDEVARNMGEQIDEKRNMTNIKHVGCDAIKGGINVLTRLIKEMIRTLDAENSEENYVKGKFGCEKELIDMKVRSAFRLIKVTTSMMKCAHGRNHYGEREAMMKKDTINQEYLRYNEI